MTCDCMNGWQFKTNRRTQVCVTVNACIDRVPMGKPKINDDPTKREVRFSLVMKGEK